MKANSLLGILAVATTVACSGGDQKPGDSGTDPTTSNPTNSETGTQPTASTGPRITLGQGETEWIDLPDGEPVMMVHGPQGGWHILGSVRTYELGDVATIDFWIVDDASGIEVTRVEHKVLMTTGDDCADCLQHIGMYGFLEVDELAGTQTCDWCGESDCVPPELLSGNPMTLCMSVEDQDEVSASACVGVVGDPDPEDLECVPD